ncbi:MAG: hypothetical protein U0136_02510 [Bdellovibrionota bacterium]
MVRNGIIVVMIALVVFMLKSTYQTRVITAVALVGCLLFLKMQKKR